MWCLRARRRFKHTHRVRTDPSGLLREHGEEASYRRSPHRVNVQLLWGGEQKFLQFVLKADTSGNRPGWIREERAPRPRPGPEPHNSSGGEVKSVSRRKTQLTAPQIRCGGCSLSDNQDQGKTAQEDASLKIQKHTDPNQPETTRWCLDLHQNLFGGFKLMQTKTCLPFWIPIGLATLWC